MATPARKVAERLGGRRVLHRLVRSDLDLIEVVRDGLPVETVEQLIERKALTREEVYRFIIPRRTLAHRKARHEPLSAEESDRATRIARVLALAADTFANEAKASGWLREPSPALGGRVPLDLLDTEGGARLVEQELVRIAHGIFA